MSFPRYESYKDSGVEWLNTIPSHWVDLPLKAVAFHNNDVLDERTADNYEILYVDISSVNPINGITSKEAMPFSAAPSRARRRVKHGDVIVSTVRTYLRAIARINEPEENLVVSTGFCVVRPSGRVFYGFLGYLLSSSYFVDAVISHSVGVSYPAINASTLVGIKVPLPPIPEQQTIAAFLDRETAKIDALIAEQQRLIELLKEKRQAVISHVVTKGLNPNVPMKDSGIDWLGEVPGHWKVKRLRFIAQLNPSKSETTELDRETEVSFLPMEAIGDDGSLNLERTRPIGEVETGYTYFREGDVTIAKITPCFENGKGAVMRGLFGGIGFGTTELIVARAKPFEATSHYLHWLFISTWFRKHGEASMYGAGGQKRVSDDFVRDFTIVFPAISEQQIIAAFLDGETAKLDTLTTEAKTAITLLQERRTALISAAVTGKIDVRGIAA